MGFASREQLLGLATRKRRHREVTLPVAGCNVRIQSLTERERSQYEAAVFSSRGGTNLSRMLDASRRLIVLCVVDGAGNRILTESDVPKLGDWDAADVSVLYVECAEHCGLNRSDIEALAKNSDTTGDDTQPTVLPTGEESTT